MKVPIGERIQSHHLRRVLAPKLREKVPPGFIDIITDELRKKDEEEKNHAVPSQS